jgi:hypothetical protein
MPGKKQVTRRAALGLIAGGGLLAATETLGFSNVTANRGVSIDTAADKDALLGIKNRKNPDQTPEFINNTADEMDITLSNPSESNQGATFNVIGGGSGSTVTFSLTSGISQEVEIDGPNPTTVDIDADLLDGGTKVGEISLERDFGTSQASQVREIQGSASSAGNSGQYSFEMENTGDIDVKIVGIRVDRTSNEDAVVVDKGDILTADGMQVVSEALPVDSKTDDQEGLTAFTSPVSLDSGKNVLFNFNKFRKGGGGPGGPNANMENEDVRITLEFGDGSTGTFDLCIGSCDF